MEDDNEEKDDQQMCCLAGCLTALVISFLFVIVVPAGLLLIVYGKNTRKSEILAIGIVLVILPILFLGIFAVYIQIRRSQLVHSESTGTLTDSRSEEQRNL